MFKYLAQIKEQLDTTGRADTWRAPPPFWFYNLMRGKTSIYNMHATVDKTQLSRSARHFTIDYYCHNQGTVYRGTVCRRYTNCKKYEYTTTAEWVYSARYSGCNQQEASGTEHHVIKLEDFPHTSFLTFRGGGNQSTDQLDRECIQMDPEGAQIETRVLTGCAPCVN